ncbi:MAG: hypothetical protein QXU52_03955 [Fervidicoccaceae archaeon]
MSTTEKRKEIKIEAKQMVTLDQVLRSDRLMKLLFVVNAYGEISEKALSYMLNELKSQGIDLGYSFVQLGGALINKMLRDDILSLLYVELLEVSGRARKLKLTGAGREALEKASVPEDFKERVRAAVEKLRPKVATVDAEAELSHVPRSRR